MILEITGRHLEITPALRASIEEKVAKLTEMFQQPGSAVHIVITAEKNRFLSECVITRDEFTLAGSATAKDAAAAAMGAIHKAEKQALKVKDKVVKRKQSAAKTAVVAPQPEEPVAIAPAEPRIINVTPATIKPMTSDEARLQLDAEANQFFVFRDADNERISVLYRRNDGNYGLIQP